MATKKKTNEPQYDSKVYTIDDGEFWNKMNKTINSSKNTRSTTNKRWTDAEKKKAIDNALKEIDNQFKK